MAWFSRDTHKHGWLSSDTYTERCPEEFKQAILAAYELLLRRRCWDLYADCLYELRDCIEMKWNQIEIDCSGDGQCQWKAGRAPTRAWSTICGNKITFCKNNIVNNPSFRDLSLATLLLHELVHACCGTELDSEIVENLCFHLSGANLPTEGDYSDMVKQSKPGSFNGEIRGQFFTWYNKEGYIKCNSSIRRIEPSDLGDVNGTYFGPKDLGYLIFPDVVPSGGGW